MAKEVKFITETKSGQTWEESIGIPDNEDPKEYVEEIFRKFNEEEDTRKKINPNYEPQYRKLKKLLGESGQEKDFTGLCDFGDKINLTTLSFKGVMFDVYQCSRCKLLVRRITFEMPSRTCKPEFSCVECNKVFATKTGLKRHNEKGKHKTPEWVEVVKNVARLT